MNQLNSVILFVGGNAAILAMCGFLARSFIQTWLAADLESFKVKLQSESERNHFKFQKLYERKLEVISELHQLSVKAGEAASYTVRMQGNVKKEDIPNLAKKITDYKERYELLNIWLDDDCCLAIDALLKQHSAFNDAVNMQQIREGGQGKDWIGKKFLDLYTQVEEDLPAAQLSLRTAFKQTLGAIEGDA